MGSFVASSSWLCAAILSSVAPFAAAQTPKLVFAHYLIYAQDSIDTYKQEIQLAQSKGIDAFALNTNVWRQTLADKIYQAASELGTGFKLFFSADIHVEDGTGLRLSPSEIVTMLTRYRTHPNQLTYRGKSFFTSWLGNDDGYWQFYNYRSSLEAWNDIFNQAGGKSLYFFIPFFPTDGSYFGVKDTVYAKFQSTVDGYFGWDSTAWNYLNGDFNTPAISPGDKDSLQVSNDLGKTYMAGVSPWFFKNLGGQSCCDSSCFASTIGGQSSCPCQVKGDYQGPGLWIQKWSQIISNPPPLVEIITWNDWIEGHYVSPGYSVGASQASSSGAVVDVANFPHQAFLELGKYYIDWYKNGREPIVSQDSLFLFYYTQSHNVAVNSVPCDILHRQQLVDDAVYAAVILSPGSSASITIRTGGTSQTFSAGQGVSVFGVGFQEGTQSVTYSRNSRTATLTGAKRVSNSGLNSYNFHVYSAFCSNAANGCSSSSS